MSLAVSAFDRVHTTFCSSLIETLRLSCTIFEDTVCYLSKFVHFILLRLHLAPPLGVTPFEFHQDLWQHKTRVSGLLRGAVCVIICLAILIQYWLVTDGQTQDHRIYHTSIASRSKNGKFLGIRQGRCSSLL